MTSRVHHSRRRAALLCALGTLLLAAHGHALAAEYLAQGLTIAKLRVVGDYSTNTVYDNTVEIWFTTPVTLPSGITCAADRVEINPSYRHLVSAAYLAQATGRKINVNIDDTLPRHGDMCEISYLDILPN